MILNTNPTEYGFFDPSMAEKGRELRDAYVTAQPFPHIVMDDFLDKETIALCLRDFPKAKNAAVASYSRKQESKKVEYRPETLAPSLRALFYSFNSMPFISFLENVTGIKGLVPDPYFAGGGLHEIFTGGYLNIHADFNHHAPLNLERRINVLIYLNENWKEEYGGCLELWEKGMKSRHARIVPLLNRCVIFNTSADSLHGNPDPICHPQGVSRRAIALYYYTATWDELRRHRTTQFEVRPNSKDAADYQVRVGELMEDVVPPVLLRTTRKVIRRVKNLSQWRDRKSENARNIETHESEV